MNRSTWFAMTVDERRSFADPSTKCVERGCNEPAGTPWGKLWCADHDDERLNRLDRQLREIHESFTVASPGSEAHESDGGAA